jgi:hypothetical protein
MYRHAHLRRVAPTSRDCHVLFAILRRHLTALCDRRPGGRDGVSGIDGVCRVSVDRGASNQASPAFLTEILPELSDGCEQGWVVSKAAMRALTVGDAVWPIIRSKHPATYLYLCARLGRSIPEAEALVLVLACPNSIMNETRGLAIWAVGQMQMTKVLDEVVRRGEELQKKDLEEFNAFTGGSQVE